MPHKHRRRDVDIKNFDLAPSKVARPLPAFAKTSKSWQNDQKDNKKDQGQSLKRKRNSNKDYKHDDTPKAFARIMQMHAGQKQRSGLDDGEDRRSKKARKTEKEGSNKNTKPESSDPVAEIAAKLKILPGERLSDFAARVNQALPVGGLARKAKQVEGMKERQTKTEKRLHKMYAEWREEEARRKDKQEELQEQQEEEDEEKEAEHGQSLQFPTSKKTKRKRMVGELDDDDEDPWAILKSKRDAPKGLHDVVQEPPTMKVVPKEKFKIRNGAKIEVANVPAAAGSLKRREELGEARKEVIERYRAMMKGGGGNL